MTQSGLSHSRRAFAACPDSAHTTAGYLRSVGCRTDTIPRMVDNPVMPRYSFTLENGACVADAEATEDLADDHAALESATLVAKDLARSTAARNHYRVVVRNEAGDEIGNVHLVADLR